MVFLNDEEASEGATRRQNTEISNRFDNASKTFSWAGTWTGDLEPGMKVEIGVMRRKPDDVLEFVIDRSSVISIPATSPESK